MSLLAFALAHLFILLPASEQYTTFALHVVSLSNMQSFPVPIDSHVSLSFPVYSPQVKYTLASSHTPSVSLVPFQTQCLDAKGGV